MFFICASGLAHFLFKDEAIAKDTKNVTARSFCDPQAAKIMRERVDGAIYEAWRNSMPQTQELPTTKDEAAARLMTYCTSTR